MSGKPTLLVLAAVLSALFWLSALLSGPAYDAGITSRRAYLTRIDLITRAGPDYAGQPVRQFSWPLPGSPAIVRGFQPPTFRYGPGHRGVDLAAAAGEPVLAAGDGTVMFAGVVAGREVVSLRHLGGLHTTYEPVSVLVIAGQRVTRGERIGTVAPDHPGCPIAACLHWGAFREPAATNSRDPGDPGRQYLDPLRLIFPSRVRLLPIEDSPARS